MLGPRSQALPQPETSEEDIFTSARMQSSGLASEEMRMAMQVGQLCAEGGPGPRNTQMGEHGRR